LCVVLVNRKCSYVRERKFIHLWAHGLFGLQ
jgi:hypothetical protein